MNVSSITIKVENVSKKFSRSLKHVMLYGIQDIGRNMFGLSSRSDRLRMDEFWALNDVSFEVKKGETVGIIGANGSGKSTLLKLLNGIFMPDKGRIEIKGRVGALIEVGAGFHPMLTGRENIYVNGAILGMSKKEIDKKFDDIVKFADIGDFIDSPVKHYSSGMYVRLGFSVAVHSDPDILLIDEVLAVGDASFQNKCFKKLSEFKKEGKTIILVTHDLDAIARHCDRAVLFEGGSISRTGDPNSVVNHYYKIILGGNDLSSYAVSPEGSSINSSAAAGKPELDKFLEEIPLTDQCIYRRSYNKNEDRFGDRRAEIVDYLIVCKDIVDPTIIQSGDKIDLYLKISFHNSIGNLRYGFLIKTIDGVKIYGWNTQFDGVSVGPAHGSNMQIIKFSIKMNLTGGDFFIDIGFDELINNNPTTIDKRNDFIHLVVQAKKTFTGLVELECSYEEIKVKQLA